MRFWLVALLLNGCYIDDGPSPARGHYTPATKQAAVEGTQQQPMPEPLTPADPHQSYEGPEPSAGATLGRPANQRSIFFNGAPLQATGYRTLANLERRYGVRVPDGQYWYDRRSGAIGTWGRGPDAFIAPNLTLAGPLPANASGNTGTGVFVNHREIHAREVRYLHWLYSQPPRRGRYWLDAYGNIGIEGQRAFGNLITLANQRARMSGLGEQRGWEHYQRGVGARGGIGIAGTSGTTCVNADGYSRCY